ncbi:hypothetical protein EV702DRAFT_326930 [Suillus placidus]|uniref:Uncharacterized protein n=1 Tax=Suillus placidus TaxID=48579 RepID=A0A9P7D2F8_9AGAM|nr:hypothetical protein EV702DRAFT_326930 [Suillus placidus]
MDSSPCRQCACRGYLEMGPNECACTHTQQDHAAVTLPPRRCASGTLFSTSENPATYRSMCTLCNGAYYVHVPTPTQTPITPIVRSGYNFTTTNSSSSSSGSPALARYIQPPPSPLSNNAGALLTTPAPPNLRLWSPPSASASGSTNDRRRAPHGVSASPLTSVPVISRRAGRSGDPTRSSNPSRRQLAQRTTHTIKYLVVIHPEPVYGTVTTEFDRLFRELRCPVPQKIGSFLRQAESLGLSFKFEVTARSDEFAGPIFDTQLTNHLDGKRFVFSRPHSASSASTVMISPYTWSFLMTGKSQRSALGAKLSSSRKSTEDVTHKDLVANADKLPVPSPHHDHRIVFVVPLEFIVTGPLDGGGLHLCLAPRLWNKHFHPEIHEEDTEFTCADGCSEQLSADSDMDFDIAEFAPLMSVDSTNIGVSLFLPRPVSPVNTMPLSPLHMPRIMSFDGPASSAPSSANPATSTIITYPSVPLQTRQQSPTAAVAAWRGRIAAARTTMRSLLSDDPATITISANTASVAAQSFIDTIKSWCRCPEASRTDEQSIGATLIGLTPTSIVTGEFDVSISDGVGHGVLRSFWSEVIRMITEDSGHWQSTCDGYWVPIVTSLPPCDEDVVSYQAYGIIFRTAMLMDLEILPVSPVIVLFLLSDYTTAITSSFTTAIAPIGSQRLLAWPPPLVNNAATGRMELSIAPATDLYSMILDVDASAQITQLRHLPANAQAELGYRLQCQVFFGNQLARRTPDHVVYSSMRQAFDCLISDRMTLREHIITEDSASTIIEGMFSGRILSSPEQVIRLLAINVTPVGGILNDIITRFKLHLERYLRGASTPTQNDGSDLFGEGVATDPLLRTRLFLRCVTGSEFLPACPQQQIRLNFHTHWNHHWGGHVGIHIHTCFYAVDVLLNESSALIVEQEILADTSISTDFDRWIHSCISGNAFDHYNTSVRLLSHSG